MLSKKLSVYQEAEGKESLSGVLQEKPPGHCSQVNNVTCCTKASEKNIEVNKLYKVNLW